MFATRLNDATPPGRLPDKRLELTPPIVVELHLRKTKHGGAAEDQAVERESDGTTCVSCRAPNLHRDSCSYDPKNRSSACQSPSIALARGHRTARGGGTTRRGHPKRTSGNAGAARFRR